MLNFIENILSLVKNQTSADEVSLLYFDGYSLINLASKGNPKLLPEMIVSANELLHIVDEKDVLSAVESSLKSEIELKKIYLDHLQEIQTSENGRNFFLLIACSQSDKKQNMPPHLIEYLNNQLIAFGKFLLSFNSEHSITTSIKLLEMGSWKDFFKELNEISGDIVFIIDNEGCFLSINDSGTEMLDYRQEEILGKHLTDFIDFDTLNYTNSELSKIIEVRDEGKFEVTFITKYEKKVYVDLNVKTVFSDKRIIGLLGVGRNITMIRQLEARLNELEPRLIEAERLIKVERARSNQHKALLDELNRMKSEFVSNISHELRTPLASIVGFSETINSDPHLPGDLRMEFNSIILNEGKRLAKLINDVLDLSRIEAGVVALNKTQFDIVELTKLVAEEHIKLASLKKIVFTMEILTEQIIIEADKERIGQALQAIMNNAIKFTEPGGRITVIISNLYREVEIIISDTGIGIPERDMPFIFEKFYKGSRQQNEVIGTGIGLVFVKQIVDLHKGLITVQSEPKKGTTVILKLLKNVKER